MEKVIGIGIVPDVFTYIVKEIENSGLKLNVVSYNSMIDEFVSLGHMKDVGKIGDALRIREEMNLLVCNSLIDGVIPDEVGCCTLLRFRCFFKMGNVERALGFWKITLARGFS
ncbi:hypothetical protein GQ457_03G039040 [Hibiscus cannabinus]